MGDPGTESKTLKLCIKKLELSIKINLTDIALFLFQQDVLSKVTYSAVTSNRSRLSPDDCAHEVFMALSDAVEQDKDVYKMFVDYLRSETRMHKIVEVLDEQFSKLRAPADTPKLTPSLIPQEAPKEDVKVPDQFSKSLRPKEFADWMKSHYHLPKPDCNRIVEKDISGRVFLRLDSDGIKEFGFMGSGYYILLDALDEIKRPTDEPDAAGGPGPVAQPLVCGQKQPLPDMEDEPTSLVGNDKKSASFEARVRGEHKPRLRFNKGDEITTIEPKPYKVAQLSTAYYSMKSKTHGVALIINNKDFTNAERHKGRVGTDRDEHNLIETWLYLGYHVEVRRDVTKSEFVNIFYDIDVFLEKVCSKLRTKVENDSFVCCILSHGNKFCIYSSDSKEVPIESLERGLGDSEILNSKPKIFFIQACQGGGSGTRPIQSNLQTDGEIQTSRRADMYISYATAPGDMSYRHTEKGSWFITAVCKTLCKESTCCSLNEMQHSINMGVSDEPNYVYTSNFMLPCKQQPSCSDQLRKNLHFFLS